MAKQNFDFKPWDVVEFCDEIYVVVKNYGDSGEVRDVFPGYTYHNFYWRFQGADTVRVSDEDAIKYIVMDVINNIIHEKIGLGDYRRSGDTSLLWKDCMLNMSAQDIPDLSKNIEKYCPVMKSVSGYISIASSDNEPIKVAHHWNVYKDIIFDFSKYAINSYYGNKDNCFPFSNCEKPRFGAEDKVEYIDK